MLDDEPILEQRCTACGREEPASRRFCSRCGHELRRSTAEPMAAPATGLRAWWQRVRDSHDRAARRAYRRSLPGRYRWRRVALVLLAVVVVVAGGLILPHNPVQLAQAAWYQFRGEYVRVKPVTVALVPPAKSAPRSNPAALVDARVQEWTMRWAPKGEGNCAGAPGTGAIDLKFAPTRVRKIQIRGGLAAGNVDRPLEPRPARVGITYPGQACVEEVLEDNDEMAGNFAVDSGVPVTSVQISVISVYPGKQNLKRLSFTEITLQKLPVG